MFVQGFRQAKISEPGSAFSPDDFATMLLRLVAADGTKNKNLQIHIRYLPRG